MTQGPIFVFRYQPAIDNPEGPSADGAGRYHPASSPARPVFHALYLTAEERNSAEPLVEGEYVVYQGAGKVGKDGVWPRLELLERLRVHPPEPVKPKVSKVQALGD